MYEWRLYFLNNCVYGRDLYFNPHAYLFCRNNVNQMIFKSKSADIICMWFHRVISDVFPSSNCCIFLLFSKLPRYRESDRKRCSRDVCRSTAWRKKESIKMTRGYTSSRSFKHNCSSWEIEDAIEDCFWSACLLTHLYRRPMSPYHPY